MAVLPWDKDAERELKKVPFFVRPLVRKKVGERVVRAGGERVTLADFKEAEARHRSVMAGKSEDEIKKMFPRDNEAGVQMVLVEVCHNELSSCPHPLIKTNDWREAIEDWAQDRDVSERLRARVEDETIKFHHKFRISISGCPNGCSRPQIADVGVMGLIRPEFDPAECEQCGACAEVCPDEAISMHAGPPWFDFDKCLGCKRCAQACPKDSIGLTEPTARIIVGGKLGRHPRLAETLTEVESPTDAIAILDHIANDYIDGADPDERFADYWAREGKERYHG